MRHQPTRRSVLGMLGAAPIAAGGLLSAAGTARAEPGLDARIQEITGRPEFAGSRWGMRFHVHDTDEPVYALNPDHRFVAASAIKVFIAGSAFSALGPGYRFRTRVHRTGPVSRGVLNGHLILVAGGDLLLGPRIRPDGTIALPNPDHSYGTATGPIPGDALRQLRELARQVARRGVRRVAGRVLVDASLFRQGREEIANGFTPIPVSPMMLNDNIVDVVVTPGGRAGAPAGLLVSPRTEYVDVLNDVTTIPTGQRARPLTFTTVSANPDGTHTVRLTGDVPLGGQPVLRPYYVPDPVRFAEIAFTQALREEGVDVADDQLSTTDQRRNRLAEQVSPPLSEQVKVMLKLSSNVHTVYFPYLVGAIAGRDPHTAKATGEGFQRALIERAGLDPDDPSNGGHTSDFFVQFLRHMARQRYFPDYRRSMAIMGRDGTLTDVEPDSPAAGRVFAKTGTAASGAAVHKAMAGYIVLPGGTLVVFAEFMNQAVRSLDEAFAVQARAGAAQGEIVTAVYESLTT
ncbi:MAG TPA: D-alanyl-D-alanine carboxypeptidase/D-alanyl-D-alanine-endopeptidase [Actinophytocola sp.]|uniref:D-alanyl-D-alanine carboxypeptidase/D-alanyl-D-alanine endopeptidase n=1 Tax=Actinophytocola sp. TaxID=1872138 RepID=UPI002DDD0ACC|nr:D-alanyl-D-alanine carboxypeptidase/D-alanyl-D-alanine-endopeptidase [Actinophytocola sp.]HEV2778424.1 D-alanyl-D-alanine carboxypeptidase/D-alanyl-D-alanine-endopeptidase [Actinophytocola sp.]